jgi:acetolactate synthase-1/2/3 large subunit
VAGERVEKIDALKPALKRALDAIASGQTFLLDVITTPSGSDWSTLELSP